MADVIEQNGKQSQIRAVTTKRDWSIGESVHCPASVAYSLLGLAATGLSKPPETTSAELVLSRQCLQYRFAAALLVQVHFWFNLLSCRILKEEEEEEEEIRPRARPG